MKVRLVNENYRSHWVDELLVARGVAAEDIDKLKKPDINYIQTPEMLDHCEEAAMNILNHVRNKSHIGMIIDSDMDGLASATIMYSYLNEIDPEVNVTYFFHDHKEHGLEDCWEKFIDAQVNLVIELDAGINDKQYHDLLGKEGIFTVVGDHHIYEGGGFSTSAIYVDNQCSPEYINKSLAGCGVSWQLCRMMDKINKTDYAFKYIDLVALGCCADVMSPLTLENGAIFDYGFKHPQHRMFVALLNKQSYSMKDIVDYTSVAFYISPLINACMRTGEPEEKLLMYKAFLHPTRLVTSNKRGAKGETVTITEEACRVLTNVKARQGRMIEKYESIFEGRIQSEGLLDNNVLLIRLRDTDTFASELNGLIATRLSNKYHKPCYILRDGLDELTKGSGRNPNGSPIAGLKTFVEECPYVTQAIGHEGAHGLFVKTPCVDKFIDWFNDKTKDMDFGENSYNINFVLTEYDDYLDKLCWDVAKHNYLWGGDNPQPVISLNNIHLNTKDIVVMGSKNDTLKFIVSGVPCIIFKSPALATSWSKPMDIVINAIGRPNLNVWQGRESVQLLIDDLDWHENSICDF